MAKKVLDSNIDVNDLLGERYNTEILPGKFFVQEYGGLFNTYSFHLKINVEEFFAALFKKYRLSSKNYIYQYLATEERDPKVVNYNGSEFLISFKKKILLSYAHDNFKLYYSPEVPIEEIHKIISLAELSKETLVFRKKFFMVVANQNSEYGFELQKFDIHKTDVDLTLNYNDDLLPIHKMILSFLNNDRANGLVVLHGKYGTGKTTYLRHVISKVNKRIIFLPLDLMDSISSPGFLPFISQYKDSILIIEDCEELLRPREFNNYRLSGIANLLNMGDGLLADALSIKIICTFNAELKFIDKALLRKGRLVARYEFKELIPSKVKALSKKLGFVQDSLEPMTLADVYNQQADLFPRDEDGKRLGF